MKRYNYTLKRPNEPVAIEDGVCIDKEYSLAARHQLMRAVGYYGTPIQVLIYDRGNLLMCLSR